MTKTETQAKAQPATRRLSPELSEFLHMLKALEGQTAEQAAPAR